MRTKGLRRFLNSLLIATLLLIGVSIIHGASLANRTAKQRMRKNSVVGPSVMASSHAARTWSVAAAYGTLPLSFEPNEGQATGPARYISHGSNYALFLTRTEAVITVDQPAKSGDFLQKLDAKKQKKFEARKIGHVLTRLHQHHSKSVVRIGIDGANSEARIEALDKLPGYSNYFIGSDRTKWRTGIPNYARVRYKEIYPGIDLIYYGNQHRLEFDFVVSPGADPKQIALKFSNNEHARITSTGSLLLGPRQDPVSLYRPSIYQIEDGKRRSVDGAFMLSADGRARIRVGAYDRKKTLIIDPVLAYSTYLSGSHGADSDGIAVDQAGDAYIAGSTSSTDFPVVNGYQTSGPTSYLAYVAELDPSGTHLLYSTYLGGTSETYADGIALDANANIYVTGYTFGTDFPVVNGFQPSNNNTAGGNGFIARIDTSQAGTASLLYSSYLGGGGNPNNPNPWLGDLPLGIAADWSGRTYVTGITTSDTSIAPFPTTSSAYQSSLNSPNGNAFLTVVDTNQSGVASLAYSTYLGGDGAGALNGDFGEGVAVDNSGDAYLVGETTSDSSGPFPTTPNAFQSTLDSPNGNVFLAEIATSQSGSASLVYSTYFGGSTTNSLGDYGGAIALDSAGKVYIAGDAVSSDFPFTSGAFQTTNSANGKAFIAKFDLSKSGVQSLVYSTFLGGMNSSSGDTASGIAVDASRNAFAAGTTSSTDFPVTSDAFQATLKSSGMNAFLSEISPDGTTALYSTYLGGSSAFGDAALGVALDSLGNAYIAGYTESSDFPMTANAFQATLQGSQSGWVAKFALIANPQITATIVPSPNSNGWNNSPVTVTFACTPGPDPIQNCSRSVMVRAEGANQLESGTVQDTAGNAATTTATVNLDMTAPAVTITSPSNGASVTTGTITVTGTIIDALSGPGGVICHGAQATLNGSTFSCNVQLSAGTNSISVIGTDLAGNSNSVSISVTNTGASGQTNPPVINGISPNQGGIDSVVTLTGSSFGIAQGNGVVMFNGIAAQVTSWSDSGITASVPAGLNLGAATVTVGVNGSASNVVQFTVTQPLYVTPSQVTMVVTDTRPIQLVDENGVPVSATWTVGNSSVAQIVPPANGQPTLLQADAVGITTLVGTYGNRTGVAQVTVLPTGTVLPIGAVLWDVPSLGSYGISDSVQSVRVDDNTPDLYIEDDGAYGGNGAIRALTADGQQKWIWPPSASDAFPLLLAADNQGGAIYFANQDTPNQFESWCYFGRVDENGTETWEYQESNCNEDYAVAPDGTIYLMEDDFQNSGTNVVTALDPTTGQIKFTVPLPGFDSFAGGADYTLMPPPGDPNGVQQPYCTPGASVPGSGTSANAQSFEHGSMSVAADGTVYIPLTGGTTFFDGEPCDSSPDPNNPGYTHVINFSQGAQGSFTDSRTVYLMAIKPDGSYTTQTVNSQYITGPGWFAAPQYDVFMQRPIPDGQGGMFLPVEQTLYHTGGSGGNVSLPFTPLPDGLVLGSGGIAFVTGFDSNNIGWLAGIDTAGSSVKWTVSPGARPLPSTVTSDGSLAFRYWSPSGSSQYVATASPTGQVSPLFAGPGGSDVGPVIPITYGSHLPSYWNLGAWNVSESDGSLAAVVGNSPFIATSAWPETGGGTQRQNAPKRPFLEHFAPEAIAEYGVSTYAQLTDGMDGLVPKSSVNRLFFMGGAATPELFLKTLAKPTDAVGFAGHSFDIAGQPPIPTFSVGLVFDVDGSAVVRPSQPTDNPLYDITSSLRLVKVTHIETQARVVFIGVCFTGTAFENLWNIHDAVANQPATVGQSMIVLSNPSSEVPLGHAWVAWERILDDMINKHMTVGNAVAEADAYLPTIGVSEQYKVIGDKNVKITN